MKEFKTALKEVLDGQTGAGKALESVNKINKSGNFVPAKSDFPVIYFEEPTDKPLIGRSNQKVLESKLNIYCSVASNINDRETHEAEVEALALKVAGVILDNLKLSCASYPNGFCNPAFTTIGEIKYGPGRVEKSTMPVEIAVIPITVRYVLINQ